MDVVFLSPAYPAEMREYTRGLADVGARVFGVGDTPAHALPPDVRLHLHDYLQVPRIMDEADVVQRVRAWLGRRTPDRIEAQWEPLVLTAARLRESMGVPGMSYDTVLGFRDKQLMKERIQRAGLRVPHSARCRSVSEVRKAIERIGYPVCLKPIAGAGSADTWRVNDPGDLERILPRIRHVPELSCEEFVEGEEFTYDTVCIDGQPVFENVAQYLPRPLVSRQEQWISPVIITVAWMSQPHLAEGIALGRGVLDALGMGTGFTHMEWYRKADGEVVFGEIGCRPGGAHLVDQMNYTCDVDLFREWARAVCWGRFAGSTKRLYNTAIIFKRAQGEGRIQRVEGLRHFTEKYRPWICAEALLPVGAPRRDWKQTLLSDGYIILRHPVWEEARRMAFEAARSVKLFAG